MTFEIPEENNWTSSWEENELAQMRAFQALSFSDKVRAVEGMEETARWLRQQAEKRKLDLDRPVS